MCGMNRLDVEDNSVAKDSFPSLALPETTMRMWSRIMQRIVASTFKPASVAALLNIGSLPRSDFLPSDQFIGCMKLQNFVYVMFLVLKRR